MDKLNNCIKIKDSDNMYPLLSYISENMSRSPLLGHKSGIKCLSVIGKGVYLHIYTSTYIHIQYTAALSSRVLHARAKNGIYDIVVSQKKIVLLVLFIYPFEFPSDYFSWEVSAMKTSLGLLTLNSK